MNGLPSHRPVKQRRALLESNPPRDNWIERRRNKKRLRIRGDQNLPECNLAEPFYFEPEYASQNSSKSVSKSSNAFSNIDTTNNKKYKETPLVSTRFFEASAKTYSIRLTH
jgi:hypothetical protein